MELEMTPQQIQKSISATFDSVNLINELKSKRDIKGSLSGEEENTLSRNEEHIKIMLAKDWFVEALTEDEKNQLESI